MSDPVAGDPPLGRRLPRAVQWFLAEGLGALVGILTALVALLFTLFPDLKPFTATKLAATVEVVTVERAVTRDQWRWRVAVGDRGRHDELVRGDREAASGEDPCVVLGTAPGFTIYVSTRAEGFKRKELTMRAALYRHRTGHRIPDQEQYRSLARVPVDAPTADSVQEIWLYDPGHGRGQYFARVQLYDSKNHLLDIADSKPFPKLTPVEHEQLSRLPQDCSRKF